MVDRLFRVIGRVLLVLSLAVAAGAATSPSFDEKAAERFAMFG
jgi:hypothetical protein